MTQWFHLVSVLSTLASSGLPYSSPADTIRARVAARIGAEGSVIFERVEAVEIDDAGNMYVLDGSVHELIAFSPSGKRLWTVGREGEGPGEFRSPVGLTWAPDGALWVIDPENQRVTAVSRDGAVSHTYRLPAGFNLSPWPGRFDRTGRFYSYLSAAGGSYDYVMGVFDEELTQVDVVTPPTAPEAESFFEGRTERGSHVRARVPFTPSFIWRLDSHGRFVTTWTASLTFYGASGRLRHPSDNLRAGPRVTRSERRAAVESLDRFVRNGGRVDEGRIPDTKPILRTFVLDEHDRIWALLSRAAESRQSRFEVIGSDGARAITVLVPVSVEAFPTIIVRGGWMIGVERDELGVQSVVLIDVRQSGRESNGPRG